MRTKRQFQLTLRQRENVFGYIFILPFIVGFILFILAPIVQSVIYSLNDIKMEASGIKLTYIGAKNCPPRSRTQTSSPCSSVQPDGCSTTSSGFWSSASLRPAC